MEREQLLRDISACGLVCRSCTEYNAGPIAEHAQALERWLEGFDVFAERFSAWQSRFVQYPAFRDVLAMLAHGCCSGCRSGDGCMPGCAVRACTRERGLDFCAECAEFPCDKAGFEGQLRAAWLAANERMQAIGAEAFWQAVRERGHYA